MFKGVNNVLTGNIDNRVSKASSFVEILKKNNSMTVVKF